MEQPELMAGFPEMWQPVYRNTGCFFFGARPSWHPLLAT
jgi:hypothetical protein